MTTRTATLAPADVTARAKQARAFLQTAELNLGDSLEHNSVAGTNSVMAGIAAADAMCGRVLGYCSKGEDHQQAVALLRQARPGSASLDLARLLGEKSNVSYSPRMLTNLRTEDLVKYARRLVAEMDLVLSLPIP